MADPRDLTSAFDALLEARGASSTPSSFSSAQIDSFLQTARSINTNITALHTELSVLRQAYLSTATPSRKSHLASTRRNLSRTHDHSSTTTVHLTDADREEIDTNGKSMLRELNASIRLLAHQEQTRQQQTATFIKQRYGSGRAALSAALGKWAAGSAAGTDTDVGGKYKNAEHEAAVEAEKQVAAHRETVLMCLRERLSKVAVLQEGMISTRIQRETERNSSVLAKAGLAKLPDGFAAFPEGASGSKAPAPAAKRNSGAWAIGQDEEEERRRRQAVEDDGLTNEQRQLFEKGNQDMLNLYNSTLDKVRTAEKSLLEISELQSMLVSNLSTQSAHIEQLVADSLSTAENVGGGNKQLKKATQRPSTARYTFFAASGLCALLILWDLVI